MHTGLTSIVICNIKLQMRKRENEREEVKSLNKFYTCSNEQVIDKFATKNEKKKCHRKLVSMTQTIAINEATSKSIGYTI